MASESGNARSRDDIAVFYLARGADQDALGKFAAFRDSYCRWPAGVAHRLYLVYKGFENAGGLTKALHLFRDLPHQAIHVDDEGFDIKAYFTAASQVAAGKVCFLNTASRICGSNWLLKLAVNMTDDAVGLAGCTASYEAPQHPGYRNNSFPNPHIRSNAFLIRRHQFLAMRPTVSIRCKTDAHVFEHGTTGMSRQILSKGLRIVLVGRDGRGYDVAEWPRSMTFRQGAQANLLVVDNQTDAYNKAPVPEKRVLFNLAWGDAATARPSPFVLTAAAPRRALRSSLPSGLVS